MFGSQKFAVHVQVDPNKVAARGVGINEVAQVIRDWNVNMPTGTLFGPQTAYNIKAEGQLMNAAGYRPVTVAWSNGKPVRLQDVANVIDDVEDIRTVSRLYTPERAVRAVSLFPPAPRQGDNQVESRL